MTGTAKQWSLVHSSGGPTARSGHCVAVVKDEMFVFGGCGHPASSAKPPPPPAERGDAEEQEQEDEVGADMDPRCLGDLHVYNAARQRWSEVPFPTSKLRPAQRTCAAICASEEEDRLFLSGGAGDDPYDLRGDLLQYDVRERSWSVLYDDVVSTGAGSEVCPFRRIGHTMVHHSASGRLVLFGGSTGLEYFDDTHAYDLATGSWTLLATVGDRPSPRYKHQAFVDADFMYVIGGGSFEPEGPDLDVYRLALVAGDGGGKALEWERLMPTGTPPRCRAAHGLAWDGVGRVAYIWGGFTSGMELDSTFCALRLSPPATLAAPTPPAAAATAAAAVASPVVAAAATTTSGAPATVAAPISAVASFDTPPAAAAAAPVAIDEFRDLGGSTDSSRMMTHRRNRRALSADAAGVMAAAVAATAARNNKPLGSASGVRGEGRGRRASASGTELAEQQQWQHEQERDNQERRQPQEQEQEEQQQHSPPLSSGIEDARSSGGGVDGRERWRRRGQRLWRQGSGGERGGGSEGRNSSGSSRRSRSRRRRPWGQGWTTGRLQGLWGGGGSGDGGAEEGGANHPPPPSPRVAVVASTAHAAVPPPVPVPPDTAPSLDNTGAAATVAVGEELSWVTLPSGQGGSAACVGARGELPAPPSPAGRSFHCAFFLGGACYVTGGSDGARKFGDMWRFPARESPPPLTTLAARAFLSSRGGNLGMVMRKGGGSGGSGGSVSDGSSGGGDNGVKVLLQSLPEELREALENLNMQAEVVL